MIKRFLTFCFLCALCDYAPDISYGKLPDTALSRAKLAEKAIAQKQYPVALSIYKKLHMENPHEPAVMLRLAEIYDLQSSSGLSLFWYNKFSEFVPEDQMSEDTATRIETLKLNPFAVSEAKALVGSDEMTHLDDAVPAQPTTPPTISPTTLPAFPSATPLPQDIPQNIPSTPNRPESLDIGVEDFSELAKHRRGEDNPFKAYVDTKEDSPALTIEPALPLPNVPSLSQNVLPLSQSYEPTVFETEKSVFMEITTTPAAIPPPISDPSQMPVIMDFNSDVPLRIAIRDENSTESPKIKLVNRKPFTVMTVKITQPNENPIVCVLRENIERDYTLKAGLARIMVNIKTMHFPAITEYNKTITYNIADGNKYCIYSGETGFVIKGLPAQTIKDDSSF